MLFQKGSKEPPPPPMANVFLLLVVTIFEEKGKVNELRKWVQEPGTQAEVERRQNVSTQMGAISTNVCVTNVVNTVSTVRMKAASHKVMNLHFELYMSNLGIKPKINSKIINP